MVGIFGSIYIVGSAVAGILFTFISTGSVTRTLFAAVVSGGIGAIVAIFPFFPTVAGTFSLPIVCGVAGAIGAKFAKP